MTASDILSAFCTWINGLGYKAIRGPSNNPAPAGTYISVIMQGTHQNGDMTVPGPSSDTRKKARAAMKVATVQLYEVDGDGEAIRAIQDSLQTDEFDAFVKAKFPDTSKDAGFAVWDIGDIVDNGTQDGSYFIEQKTMTVDVQFYDYVEHKTERMARVEGTVNGVEFEAEDPSLN